MAVAARGLRKLGGDFNHGSAPLPGQVLTGALVARGRGAAPRASCRHFGGLSPHLPFECPLGAPAAWT